MFPPSHKTGLLDGIDGMPMPAMPRPHVRKPLPQHRFYAEPRCLLDMHEDKLRRFANKHQWQVPS